MRGTAMKGLGLFICSAILVSAHALTVEAPARQIKVARGRNATLRCNFKTNAAVDRGDLLVWRKISSRVDIVSRYFDGLTQHGEGYEQRIQFSGNVDSGDISITITAVTMEDNGTYACSVRLRNDFPAQTALLDLFVLVAPSKPECNIVGTPQYGQNINLTCVSHEGSPTPKYSWQSFSVQNEPRVLPYAEACLTTSRSLSKLKETKAGSGSFLPEMTTHLEEGGQKITLKNISADTSGFYICTSTNEVGTEFCNMTVSVVPPSMNIALYAGIIGGVVAAIVVIGIISYCCCCRASKETDYEMTVQEDRNEPSTQMPTRHESTEEDVENA